MTDETTGAPGTSNGAGRRRVRADEIGAELAALRRDFSGHAGLLAETLPRVDDHDRALAEVRALVASLITTHDENAERDRADLEARRTAGLADEPPSPWAWPVLDQPTATAAWDALSRWVAAILCAQLQLPLRRLPSCWPAHPAAVTELTALRAAHVAAHARDAHPSAALAWHRELPAALDRIGGRHGVDRDPCAAIDPQRCPPGHHEIAAGAQPSESQLERLAAQPCRVDAWGPLLRQVADADIARRRPAAE